MISSGDTFGRLTVLSCVGKDDKGGIYLCKCECGNLTEVKQCNLGRSTKSCGCIRREAAAAKGVASIGNRYGVTHGLRPEGKKSQTYNSWQSMLKRCNSPKHDAYKYYGARGVTVCSRWLEFAKFYADMGERPDGKTIDRIDPTGNYELGNCRWADAQEQATNKRPKYKRVA